MRRWEVVAVWDSPGSSLDGTVLPVTQGRHHRWTRFGASLTAEALNVSNRLEAGRHMPAARWIVRRRR